MGHGGRFSEPPIHLLCRRLGYAFREYKAVVSPGDPFLSVICRILEEGGLERLRRRPPKSFFDLLAQMKKVADSPGAESQRDIGGECISVPPSGWKDPPSLLNAGVISLDHKGPIGDRRPPLASASPTGDRPSPLNFVAPGILISSIAEDVASSLPHDKPQPEQVGTSESFVVAGSLATTTLNESNFEGSQLAMLDPDHEGKGDAAAAPPAGDRSSTDEAFVSFDTVTRRVDAATCIDILPHSIGTTSSDGSPLPRAELQGLGDFRDPQVGDTVASCPAAIASTIGEDVSSVGSTQTADTCNTSAEKTLKPWEMPPFPILAQSHPTLSASGPSDEKAGKYELSNQQLTMLASIPAMMKTAGERAVTAYRRYLTEQGVAVDEKHAKVWQYYVQGIESAYEHIQKTIAVAQGPRPKGVWVDGRKAGARASNRDIDIQLVGSQGVGKTSLLQSLIQECDLSQLNYFQIDKHYLMSHYQIRVNTSNGYRALKVLDCSDNPRTTHLVKEWLGRTHWAFVVYDLCNPQSFENSLDLLKDVQHAGANIVLFGNMHFVENGQQAQVDVKYARDCAARSMALAVESTSLLDAVKAVLQDIDHHGEGKGTVLPLG